MKRILSFALGVLFLLTVFVTALPVASAETPQSNYKRKVVSVVYDDSYSMSANEKSFHASYAFQILASLLDPRDTLEIVPMYSPSITVNLSRRRDEEIRRIMKEEAFQKPVDNNRHTPYSAVKRAVEVLEKNGLKQSSQLVSSESDTEYWLIIMTDDVKFTNEAGTQSRSIKDVMEEYVISRNYNALRTIHLAFAVDFDTNALADLEEIASKIPFTAYSAKDKNVLLTMMGKVASQLSGRYELKNGVKISGDRVTINLSSLGCSLDSVAVIAQNFNGDLLNASHNGVALNTEPASRLVMSDQFNDKSFKNGYSASLSSPTGRISGGTVELQFSKAVDPVHFTLLVTPAIAIEPYIIHNGANGKEEITAEYLNANLSPGEKISVGYRALDLASGKPLELDRLFTSVASRVTYNSKTYKIGEFFPLVEGKHEITVIVDVMNGLYMLYGSLFCNVEKDPTAFRIESNVTSEYEGNPAKSKIEYRVIFNNSEISIENLKAKHYDYSVTAVDEAGYPHPITVGVANGAAVAVLDATNSTSKYFKVKFVVQSDSSVDPKEARRRECVCEVAGYAFIPTTLALNTLGGPNQLSQHDLEGSVEGFRFELIADGTPLSFGNPSISYKVFFGDTDVTEYATVKDGILSYIPSDSHLKGNDLNPGEKKVTVSVSPRKGSAAPAKAESAFQLQKTTYVVESVASGTLKELDRFKWKQPEVVFCFRALYDGTPLTTAQMKAAYEKGELTATLPFLGFYKFDAQVEEINGQALLVCRTATRPLKFFTQFFALGVSGGNKTITVAYRTGSGTDTITITPNTLRYVLRALQLFAYIWVILLIISAFISKPLPEGVFVQIFFNENPNVDVGVSAEPCNLSIWAKIKYFFWRVPFFYQCPYWLQVKRKKWFNRCPMTFHSTISFCYKGKTLTFICFDDDDQLVPISRNSNVRNASLALSNYINTVKNYYFDHTSNEKPDDVIPIGESGNNLKVGAARALFPMPRTSARKKDESESEEQINTIQFTTGFLAKIDKEETHRRISYIIFFIEKSKS